MNKFIKEELEKCSVPLPVWNEDTLTLLIPYNTEQQSEQVKED